MTLSASARAAVDELQADTNALSRACARAFFDTDEQVCMNVAGEAQDFINDRVPRMLVRIDAGDTNAAEDLVRGCANIRAMLASEAAEVDASLSFGALLGRFADEVVLQTGRDIPVKAPGLGAKTLFGFVAAALGVALAVNIVSSSAASGVKRVRKEVDRDD